MAKRYAPLIGFDTVNIGNGSNPPALAAGVKVAVFGNSIWYYHDSDYYTVADATTNYGLLVTILVRGCGPAVLAAGTGTLEYRASDKKFRWTAPTDSPGPWTDFVTTRAKLQSGTADKWLLIFQNSNVPLPTVDVTVSISVALNTGGAVTTGPETRGAFNWLRALAYQPWAEGEHINCAVGGATSAGLVNGIPLYENMVPDSRFLAILGDIITNDVTNVASSGAMPAALQTLKNNILTWVNWAIDRGAIVELVGAGARYKSGTTPLDSWQLSMTLQADEFLKSLASQNPDIIHYTPVYPKLVDATLATPNGAPATNALVDLVHHNVLGAWLSATEVLKSPFIPRGSPGRVGDPRSSTVAFNGSMQTSTAASGTGVSGVMPATITNSFGRASGGVDFVGVGSYVARTDNGASGNWFRQAITWVASTTGIFEYRFRSFTLAELGKSVGDTMYSEIDFRFDNCVNVQSIQIFHQFIGASGTQRSFLTRDDSIFIAKTFPIAMASGGGRLRSYKVVIPPGTTSINTYCWTNIGAANGSADIYLANFDIY